jgi:hypothetical protein
MVSLLCWDLSAKTLREVVWAGVEIRTLFACADWSIQNAAACQDTYCV